jgi:hypothetical protein
MQQHLQALRRIYTLLDAVWVSMNISHMTNYLCKHVNKQ